jgi:hypothetical protein
MNRLAEPTFAVTLFRDFYAFTKEERTVAAAEFVEMVESASAAHKRDLPWLKLATFGNSKTGADCLRTDKNLLQVFGVEGDYDGEAVSFDEALELARKARVLTVLYTSPSHTPEAPKWRAIHPFAEPMLPSGRAAMMDRANGIFGGVLARESWVLSQSYYYGRLNDDFRIELVEGECIDTRPDIASIGKPTSTVEINAYAEGAPISVEEFRAAGAAAAIGAADLPYPQLMALIAATARVNVVGDDNRAVREEIARVILAATPESRMDENRFQNAFNAPIREDQKVANPATFFHYAKLGRWVPDPSKAVEGEGVRLADFHAYMPSHSYIFAPTRAFWPAASVNSRIPPVPLFKANGEPVLDDKEKPVKISPSAWLDRNKPVEQMTWAPGLPMTIPDKLAVLEGGWIDRRGVTSFNQYRPPTIEPGDAAEAQRWVDHVRYVYPNDAEHIVNWLAHRTQKPGEKINHSLVLGGEQGIGKDMLLVPVGEAVGTWNCQEASPTQILGRFNGFLKSVILRISEARDLGDYDRFAFYDHMKTYSAAPPDMLRCDEKNLREYPVVNCCGVIITTNHKTDGIYLPPDDRRHYVAWSDRTKEDQRYQNGYWKELADWYSAEGTRHVAAFLLARNISEWDAKAPPPKTETFWEIVNANRSTEESELADTLDLLGTPASWDKIIWPDVVGLEELQLKASGAFLEWISDRKNRRAIPHRLEACGYVPVRNPDATDGKWKMQGRRRVLYAKKALSEGARLDAVRETMNKNEEKEREVAGQMAMAGV